MAEREDFVYNSSLDAFTLYHVITEQIPEKDISPILPAVGHALAGSLATAATKALLYPLDLVVTRLQVQKKLRGEGEAESAARSATAEYVSIADAARKIYENEGGLGAFYTGCSSDVTKGLVDSFVFFLAYTFLRQRQLKSSGRRNLPVFSELAVGVVAGSFSKLVTTPLQNIVTRQQTAALIAARNPSPNDTPGKRDMMTVRQIAAKILEERGLAGFWAGYGASLILTMNPAITFAVDNVLKKIFVPASRRQNPPAQLTFLIAACSKAVATTITYPVQLAKSRAQAAGSSSAKAGSKAKINGKAPGGSEKTPKKTFLQTLLRPLAAQYAIFVALRDIAREEGISGLYSGLEGDVLKGFLSHGLTMAVKDRVHGGVIQVYYSLLHLTQQYEAQVKAAQEQAAMFAEQAARRAENMGSSVVEAGKAAVEKGEEIVNDVDVVEGASNIGTSVVESAKSATQVAQDAVSNTGASIVDSAKNVSSQVAERAETISTTIVAAGKSAVEKGQAAIESTGAVDAVKNIGSQVAGQVTSVSTTVVEAGKSVATKGQEVLASTGITEGVEAVSAPVFDMGKQVVEKGQELVSSVPVPESVNNAGTTIVEASKNATEQAIDAVSNTTPSDVAEAAKSQATEISSKAVEASQSVAESIGEKADNVATTIAEAGKQVYREGEKIVVKKDD